MKKVTVNDIIEFTRLSDRRKRTFVNNLKIEKVNKKDENGNDYWIGCKSTISNVYRDDDISLIDDRIAEIQEKLVSAQATITRNMHQRNIDILQGYIDYDFSILKPSTKIAIRKKQNANSVITINNLPVKALPHHVFSFTQDEAEEVGAIWFVAKLYGYRKDELGMFADIQHTYLQKHFSDRYAVNPKYCIAVDLYNRSQVNYLQVQNEEIPAMLSVTIEDIKRLM